MQVNFKSQYLAVVRTSLTAMGYGLWSMGYGVGGYSFQVHSTFRKIKIFFISQQYCPLWVVPNHSRFKWVGRKNTLLEKITTSVGRRCDLLIITYREGMHDRGRG